MSDFRAKVLAAAQAADRLHIKYDTKARADAGEGRVDVFDMLLQQDIPTMFRRLDKLLGAFLEEDGEKGVIVTTERQLPVQRFTAAHELGHAVLGHRPSADPEEILARSPFVEREDGAYDLQEIQANVFASALLIPRWLLMNHMKRQGWSAAELAIPDVVYQLSLRLGASYSATCHGLLRYKVIDRNVCDRLLGVKPRTIKERLAAPYVPIDWRRDVWVVTGRDDGTPLEGGRSDLVVARVEEHSGSGYLWRFDDLAKAGLVVVDDRRTADTDADVIGAVVFRSLVAGARVAVGAVGRVSLREVRPWQATAQPLHSLNFGVDFSGPVTAGLHKSQRLKALAGAA